ncbi:MAG: zf-HC2 domain-containing protein [Chloroflexota bacterium]|nr:zf-HC2 domain-containing protein [Chloroflexota bacterium]
MVDPDELTCRELVELVTDYLEGTLPAVDRQRFEEHLLNCDECPIYVAQMRMTIRAVGALTEEHIPPIARDELLRRFGDWKRNRS